MEEPILMEERGRQRYRRRLAVAGYLLKHAQPWQMLSKLGAYTCEACGKLLARVLP